MALVKIGSVLSDISGKLGGVIFQNGRSGKLLRILNQPINKRVLAKSTPQRNFRSIQLSWRDLKPLEREAWTTLANSILWTNRFGDTYHPTGYQLFMSLNIWLINNDGTPLITPLPETSFTSHSFGEAVWDDTACSVGINPTSFSIKYSALIKASPVHQYSNTSFNIRNAISLVRISDTSHFPIDLYSLDRNKFTLSESSSRSVMLYLYDYSTLSGFHYLSDTIRIDN